MNRTATFALTESDFRQALRLHVLGSYLKARTLLRLAVIWLVGMIAFGAVMYAGGMPASELYGFLALLTPLMAAAAFLPPVAIPLVFGYYNTRRRLLQDRFARSEVYVSWDDETYQAVQAHAQSRLPWRDYFKVRANQHVFLFFISDYTYQILPRRALTPEQIADIQRIVTGLKLPN